MKEPGTAVVLRSDWERWKLENEYRVMLAAGLILSISRSRVDAAFTSLGDSAQTTTEALEEFADALRELSDAIGWRRWAIRLLEWLDRLPVAWRFRLERCWSRFTR